MDAKARKRTVAQLKRQGFDRARVAEEDYGEDDKAVRVGCSQCAAVFINGMACHETGCPNTPRQEEES